MTHDVTVAQHDHLSPNSSITTTAQDDWHASLALVGEFDAANSAALRAALDEHLDGGRRVLRIDTAGVSFMDSSAVGAIVHAHTRCHDEHGSLIITGVQPRTARLFQITGLDHVLLIDTADDNAAQADDAPQADDAAEADDARTAQEEGPAASVSM